jgi:hypothetical protein
MTRSGVQATKSRVLSGGSHPGLEGMEIRAIHPGSVPSPRVLTASPRPPKSPRTEVGPQCSLPEPGSKSQRTEKGTQRSPSEPVSGLGPVPGRTPGVSQNPENRTDPMFGTVKAKAAAIERLPESTPAGSGRITPAPEAQSCPTGAPIINFDDAMAAVASRLMDHQHAATVAVMNSDAKANAAETAAAQARESVQHITAAAEGEVRTTREQAQQAMEFADQAYSELQARAHLAGQDASQRFTHESELAAAYQNRFQSEEVFART